eukprot:CAMPEP_0118964264 /NCGR_PEP_ID=MMETSP1173-20130426/1991_1 /TAXON_ID=1034831 /ORGANISM="Rhizochromulina marina cf, Strain CCMP1243" /LENGTH=106 /DNA_ID=CAMNT_0006912695 /DNA_START=484 /DNA_END=806 /DNA_ORIENTATION=+
MVNNPPNGCVRGSHFPVVAVFSDLIVAVVHEVLKPLHLSFINPTSGVCRLEHAHIGLDVDEHVQHAGGKILSVQADDVIREAEGSSQEAFVADAARKVLATESSSH